MILPIKGFFFCPFIYYTSLQSSDSMFDLFFDQTETRKARSSTRYFDEFNKINVLKF